MLVLGGQFVLDGAAFDLSLLVLEDVEVDHARLVLFRLPQQRAALCNCFTDLARLLNLQLLFELLRVLPLQLELLVSQLLLVRKSRFYIFHNKCFNMKLSELVFLGLLF